ncbi:MAG: DUF2169 domain-containing protein [Sandaracinaceae bacterium]|nr:DUF2169 domain-containing protein [Sandaracinaceae bacterium]
MLPPPELRAKGLDAIADMVPMLDVDGSIQLVVLVKLRVQVDRFGRTRRTEGAEIHRADVPHDPDAPESSSIRFPCDLCLRKPGTDVIVVGHARPTKPGTTAMDVLVRVGPVQKALRVFGPRYWRRGVTGLTPSAPEPIEAVPLTWELAFGGFDSGDGKLLEEPRNPVGRGLKVDVEELVDQLTPQIEDPDDLLSTHRSRPRPAGVGALGRHWVPRRGFAGTYDEEWKTTHMPLPPIDFDDRFNQCATPELIVPGHLRGGEPVQLLGVTARGAAELELPRPVWFVGARVDGRLVEHPPVLDTIVIETDDLWIDMTWRSRIPLPRPARRLEYVQVHEKRAV